MRPQVSWTTAEERCLIVDQALALLDTVGMRFGGCASLERLAYAGARVDREAGVARLPRKLVERALAGCLREVLLAGRPPSRRGARPAPASPRPGARREGSRRGRPL